MTAPRFANPHLLVRDTEIVSRAALRDELDVPAIEREEDSTEALSALEQAIKASLGDIAFPSFSEPSPEPKRKRRKLEVKHDESAAVAESEEPILFRLVSGSTTLVSLQPKPPPEIKAYERSHEDDEEEAALRAQCAAAVAVDASSIMLESRAPSYPSRKTKGKLLSISVTSLQPSPVMVIETAKHLQPLYGGLPPDSLKLPEKTRPSPHELPTSEGGADGLSCPIIAPDSDAVAVEEKQRTRRKHKARGEALHPPGFFRPQQEWGGKSAGYALGYKSSRPIPEGLIRKWSYHRDKTRKGIASQW